MSGKYKGFWDPSQLYEKGDIVEYYSSQVDDVDAPSMKNRQKGQNWQNSQTDKN